MKAAVIFDMDGVLTDSEPFYLEAVNATLAAHGVRLAEEDHAAIMGSSIDYTWDYLIRRFDLAGPKGALKAPYDRKVVEILSQKVEPAAGLHALLEQFQQRGLKLAVATSSQLNWAETILGKLRIAEYFPVVVTTQMVEHPKPAPDLYALACKRLAVAPGEAIAIEDSPRGVQAATTAGITTVAVRTPSTMGLDVGRAQHVINSLSEFKFSWLD